MYKYCDFIYSLKVALECKKDKTPLTSIESTKQMLTRLEWDVIGCPSNSAECSKKCQYVTRALSPCILCGLGMPHSDIKHMCPSIEKYAFVILKFVAIVINILLIV